MDDLTLGLDIGANSIGWALINESATGDEERIIATGVRIFPEGVNLETSGTAVSKCVDRRMARQMRRNHWRRAMRKRNLRITLTEVGLLPRDKQELVRLMQMDPYAIRAAALDRQVPLYELGRALYHICQRRGFKSSRKSGKANEDGVINKAIGSLEKEIAESGARTVGEYLHRLILAAKPTELDDAKRRARNRHTSRAMFEHEFDLIWNKQRESYPDLLTDDLRRRVSDRTIFYQRPLRPMDERVGFCDLEHGERRCPRANWYAQQFVMLQEVNHLRIVDADSQERPLNAVERAALVEELQDKDKIDIDRARKVLGLAEPLRLNIEGSKKSKIPGNRVQAEIRKALKKTYSVLAHEQIVAIADALIALDDAAFAAKAPEWGLDAEEAGSLLKREMPSGYLSLSLKAVKRILPFLELGMVVSEAKAAAYPVEQHSGDCLRAGLLPRIVDPGSKDAGSPGTYPLQMTNPTVRRALAEVRRVVNLLIKTYGKPARIRVELAREARNSIPQRNEILLENRKNEREREEIREKLVSEFQVAHPGRDDILKYRLWQECGRVCPYTGRPISAQQLYHTGEVEIEHILPYSVSLDDSYSNKTLCFVDENRAKGNRLPAEYYAGKPQYEAILQRVASLPYPKRRRFVQKEVDTEQAVARLLNDTKYISRVVVGYLKTAVQEVNCTRGTVTAALRRKWGLHSILSLDGEDRKNRDDHRHHAVDALAIALTTAKHIKELAYTRSSREIHQEEPPWPFFRFDAAESIGAIKVSHRTSRKVSGKLHAETIYGKTEKQDEYVHRKRLVDLKPSMVSRIRDAEIRKLVQSRCVMEGDVCKEIPKNAFAQPLLMKSGVPVRKVRIFEPAGSAVPVGPDKTSPTGYVLPSGNHHMEIFTWTDKKGRIQKDGVVVTLIEAARRLSKHEPVVSRVHPQRPDARFVMSLSINDTLRVFENEEDDKGRLYRVQKISEGDIALRPLSYAGDLKEQKPLRKTPMALRAAKVVIDPIGRESFAND